MDIRDELRAQTKAIMREHGAGWVAVCNGLLERIEELEQRMAMYEHPIEPSFVDLQDEQVALEESVKDELYEVEHQQQPPVEEKHEHETEEPQAEGNGKVESEVATELRALIHSGEAKKSRQDAGMSAAEVARRVGVSGSAVRGYEEGHWFPSANVAEKYLEVLHDIRHGDRVERPDKPPRGKVKEPNGLHCLGCGKELTGYQTKFCSSQCSSKYYYVSEKYPDATPEEVTAIVVGAGIRGKGQKVGKYRRLDKEKAQENIRRALESSVPAMSAAGGSETE